MNDGFTLSQFLAHYSDDDNCLDEILKLRYPDGILCRVCNKQTKHYKVQGRSAYSCKYCRTQVYPLSGTIFEKTTTPLSLWFYAFFLMTHTRGSFSAKQLQREIRVTYKTAWRIKNLTRKIMEQNNGDLLRIEDPNERIRSWTFFNKFEITVAEKVEKQ